MRTTGDTSRIYARAFAARVRILAYQAELGEHLSQRLASRILVRRFELAFAFFLDGPSLDRLGKVVAFEAEIEDRARRLPNPTLRPEGH